MRRGSAIFVGLLALIPASYVWFQNNSWTGLILGVAMTALLLGIAVVLWVTPSETPKGYQTHNEYETEEPKPDQAPPNYPF